MSVISSGLVAFKSLSLNQDMHSLYTKIVKNIEIYKQFSENLSTNMPTFLAVIRLYSRFWGRLGRFDVLGSLSVSILQSNYMFSATR